MRAKLVCHGNLILEAEGINLLVTFIQWFLTQTKLSLILTDRLLYPHKMTDITHTKMQMATLRFI